MAIYDPLSSVITIPTTDSLVYPSISLDVNKLTYGTTTNRAILYSNGGVIPNPSYIYQGTSSVDPALLISSTGVSLRHGTPAVKKTYAINLYKLDDARNSLYSCTLTTISRGSPLVESIKRKIATQRKAHRHIETAVLDKAEPVQWQVLSNGFEQYYSGDCRFVSNKPFDKTDFTLWNVRHGRINVNSTRQLKIVWAKREYKDLELLQARNMLTQCYRKQGPYGRCLWTDSCQHQPGNWTLHFYELSNASGDRLRYFGCGCPMQIDYLNASYQDFYLALDSHYPCALDEQADAVRMILPSETRGDVLAAYKQALHSIKHALERTRRELMSHIPDKWQVCPCFSCKALREGFADENKLYSYTVR